MTSSKRKNSSWMQAPLKPSQLVDPISTTLIPITHAKIAIVGEPGCGKTTIVDRCRWRLETMNRQQDNKPRYQEGEEFNSNNNNNKRNERTLVKKPVSKEPFEKLSLVIIPPEGQNDGQEVVFVELRDLNNTVSIDLTIYEPPDKSSKWHDFFYEANMLLCVIDLTRSDSITQCIKWIALSKIYAKQGMYRTALIIGNKKDVPREKRVISEELARKFAISQGVGYLEIAALNNDADIDTLTTKITQSALRLQRYQENMALIGTRQCPKGCTEGERGRPHRHLHCEGRIEYQIEYVGTNPTVWLSDSSSVVANDTKAQIHTVSHPYPVVHPGWIRVVQPLAPKRSVVTVEEKKIEEVKPKEEEDYNEYDNQTNLSNILVKSFDHITTTTTKESAILIEKFQVPSNSLTRSGQFGESTPLMTWIPEPYNRGGVGIHLPWWVARCFFSRDTED